MGEVLGQGERGGGAAMEPRPEGRGWLSLCGPSAGAGAVAAMEPRPEGRGWAQADEACLPRVDAAMEPRPEGRGWSSPYETQESC